MRSPGAGDSHEKRFLVRYDAFLRALRCVPLCVTVRSRAFSRGNKYQLMTKSLLRDGTEPAVFVPEVAKQHDVFAGAIAFGVLVSARASF